MDGSTRQLGLIVGVTGGVSLFRGATLITAGGVIGVDTWTCFEVYAVIHASSGTIQVWQDGKLVIDFTGDTLESAVEQITSVRLGVLRAWYGTDPAEICFDDFALNDTTGSVNNGRIGQGGIYPLRPVADTDVKAFTPSTGVDNYAMVDEAQLDGDATYVTGVNSGERDLYNITSLSTLGQVDAIAVVGGFRASAGAGARLAPTLRSGATVAVGSSWTGTNTYQVGTHIWDADPNTSLPWTLTALQSLQVGATML
jgi:hypothetical protein